MIYNKYIHALVESYIDSTEQMNKTLKAAHRLQKMQDEAREARDQFINDVLGKSTYKKYQNDGVFAPVPLNALGLSRRDFEDLNLVLDSEDKTDKLIERLSVKYYRNDFMLRDNGTGHDVLKTDIVFRTIDEVIDFFMTILVCYTKTYKTEEINWKPIVKKFRAYLKK